MVTNEQLYLAIGIPMLFNATIVGILIALANSKFEAINAKFDAKFDGVNSRLDAIENRFDDMRDLWRPSSAASKRSSTRV